MLANQASVRASSFDLLKGQRSHVLFVLSDANSGQEAAFEQWYQGALRRAVSIIAGNLSAQHFKRDEVDITKGRLPRAPCQYLAVYELSIEGAETAAGAIEQITRLYQGQAAAQMPATWLYYPVSEKVGR